MNSSGNGPPSISRSRTTFSFDQAFLKKLRADYQVGDTLKFYGEIGQYRERWQFIIRDPSWVK